jgi:hypothetical protein
LNYTKIKTIKAFFLPTAIGNQQDLENYRTEFFNEVCPLQKLFNDKPEA